MNCADTSFLCALYRQQSHSERAIATLEAIGGPIVISSLLAYEFRQAVRFQVFLMKCAKMMPKTITDWLLMLISRYPQGGNLMRNSSPKEDCRHELDKKGQPDRSRAVTAIHCLLLVVPSDGLHGPAQKRIMRQLQHEL